MRHARRVEKTTNHALLKKSESIGMDAKLSISQIPYIHHTIDNLIG